MSREHYYIERPTVLMPGLTAKPTRTGVVVAELHYSADPVAFTPEIIEQQMLRHGCVKNPDGTWRQSWQWRKELEIDWTAQAGKPVIDAQALDWQRQTNQRSPSFTYDYTIDHVGAGRWEAKLHRRQDRQGAVRAYLQADTQPESLPGGLAAVKRAVGIGIDVGEGVGASDSTIQGFFADNREQVFSFNSNSIKPTDLGRLAVALAREYNNALICCVRKMHGITVLRAILDEGKYGRVWQSKVVDRASEYNAKNFGWPGGEASSPYLFGKWVDALEKKTTILHDLTTIEQHAQYIYDEDGRITHQALVHLAPDARERHGDLVVACALAYRACLDMPLYSKKIPQGGPELHSFDWYDQQERLTEQGKPWQT
jgi:hypothetical protein